MKRFRWMLSIEYIGFMLLLGLVMLSGAAAVVGSTFQAAGDIWPML